MSGEQVRQIWDQHSPITIRVGLIIPLIWVGFAMNGQLNKWDVRVTNVERRTQDRFTGKMMDAWSRELGFRNPTLDVPDSTEIQGRYEIH